MYKMAQRLKMLNNSYIYLEKKAKGCDMKVLCDIKKESGLTWNQLGKMIEDEFKKD